MELVIKTDSADVLTQKRRSCIKEGAKRGAKAVSVLFAICNRAQL